MVKGAASCFFATVCPPAVGGFLCLLSLDRLHLHSQPPLLILLVAQFTIARLGPVLGACPVMTITIAPPLSVCLQRRTTCWHTNRQSVGIFSWKAAYYRGSAAVHIILVINMLLDIIFNIHFCADLLERWTFWKIIWMLLDLLDKGLKRANWHFAKLRPSWLQLLKLLTVNWMESSLTWQQLQVITLV